MRITRLFLYQAEIVDGPRSHTALRFSRISKVASHNCARSPFTTCGEVAGALFDRYARQPDRRLIRLGTSNVLHVSIHEKATGLAYFSALPVENRFTDALACFPCGHCLAFHAPFRHSIS